MQQAGFVATTTGGDDILLVAAAAAASLHHLLLGAETSSVRSSVVAFSVLLLCPAHFQPAGIANSSATRHTTPLSKSYNPIPIPVCCKTPPRPIDPTPDSNILQARIYTARCVYFTAFFLPATVTFLPLRVRAFVRVFWPAKAKNGVGRGTIFRRSQLQKVSLREITAERNSTLDGPVRRERRGNALTERATARMAIRSESESSECSPRTGRPARCLFPR